MSYEAGLWTILREDPTLSELVSDRIYPLALPTDPTLPAITYRLVSSPRGMVQTGPSYIRPRYIWYCWGLTYDDAIAVATAIARLTTAFKGWVHNESDEYEHLTGMFCRQVETLAFADPPEKGVVS